MADDTQVPFDMSCPPTPIGRITSFDSDDMISIASDLFTTMELPHKPEQSSESFMETLRGRFPDGPPTIILPTGPDAGLGFTKRPTEMRLSICESHLSQELVGPLSVEYEPRSRRSSVGRWCAKAVNILKTHLDESDDLGSPQPSTNPLDLRSPTSDDSSAIGTPQTVLSSLFDTSTSTMTRQTPISCRDSASSGSLLGKPTPRTKRTHPQPLVLTPVQGSPNPANTPNDPPPPALERRRPSIFSLNWLRPHEATQDEPVPVPPAAEQPPPILDNPDTSVQSSTREKKTVRIISPPALSPVSAVAPSTWSSDESVQDHYSFTLALLSYLNFSHPAKSLFIYGFILGPWCFLIGAYFLSRSGCLPLLDRDGKFLPSSTMSMLKRQPISRHSTKRVNQSIDASNDWDTRGRCRTRLASLSSGTPGTKSHKLRTLQLSRVAQSTQPLIPAHDEECIWVRRCRFASVASAFFLFLAIVAVVILTTLH